jgi:predicted HTH domain antitoxin
MGEVMVARDESIKKVLDLMKKNGLDEEKAMKKIVNLGIRDYVADLYRGGEISVREAAEILQLNYRQTLEILEEKVGGNVGREEEMKALNLARKLAEKT